MTSTNKTLSQLLQEFAKKYIENYQNEHGHLPIIEYDNQWLSPCEQNKLNHQEVYWQPVFLAELCFTSDKKPTFTNVESALGLSLHPDIKTYFTTLYSESLDATCFEGQLSLLFSWNFDDFQRLQENIIGHILMKQRLKQPETIFFALTDEEDMILVLDNLTGEVWVERVGCKPHKKLSDTLAGFIAQLSPIVNAKVTGTD